MGFSGGSANVTKAHTHDSTVVQDGGSLAANVTQFGLSAGSILYSDGSNIQELGVGSATDSLVVNAGATAPEWATAAGAGGNYSFIETITQASDAEKFLATLATDYVYADFSHLVMTGNFKSKCAAGYTVGLQMRLSHSAGSGLDTAGYYNTAIYFNQADGLNSVYWSGNAGIPLYTDTTTGQGINDAMTVNFQVDFYNNVLTDSAYVLKPCFYQCTCNPFNGYQSGFFYHESAAAHPHETLHEFEFAFFNNDYTKPTGVYEVLQDSTVSFWSVANT